MQMSTPSVLSVLSLCAFNARASCESASVSAPVFTAGDSWVFNETTEKGPSGYDQKRLDLTIERLDGSTMIVGLKRDGAPTAYEDHLAGQDWSQRHLVAGEQVTTVRPFNFPMRVGKSWSIDFVDSIRRGNQISDHVKRTYTVVGWESVTVAAGTFRALKIESKGVDEAQVEVPNVALGGAAAQSNGAATFTQMRRGGRGTLTRARYGALYYVPSIKNYVKSSEEQYNQDGVQVSRNTSELVSFKPGG